MKKIILTAFIILSALSGISAQTPGPQWEKVLEVKDQIVYVDTASIKKFENQISVLSLTVYKKPQTITSLGKEAANVKTQLLFNTASRKYTVIGTLYYDKNLKILGETSLPGFTSNSETFSVPIDGNEAMTAIYNKVSDYLKLGMTVIEQKDSSESLNNAAQTISKEDSSKAVKAEITKGSDRVAQYLSKQDSVLRIGTQKTATKTPATRPIIDNTKTSPEVKQPKETEKQKPVIDSKPKEISSGTNPGDMIFKEGTKYSFQVSSWKNKPKAEQEVSRLKAKGHNAFITEGTIRGVTWFRVRIGYFNSLEEAEAYKEKMK
jgi:cell division septation protein DedD